MYLNPNYCNIDWRKTKSQLLENLQPGLFQAAWVVGSDGNVHNFFSDKVARI